MTSLTGRVAPSQLTRDWRDWVGLAARLILGVALTYAGALKVGNLYASVMAVEAYQLPFPKWLITLTGYAQPFVEIAVGLLLIVGMFTRIGAALGVLAMIIFIAGITWAWTQGLRIDCGCFSAGGELSADEETRYLQDIIRDLGLMACGLWLMIRPTSVLAVDNWLLRPAPAYEYDDDLADATSSR